METSTKKRLLMEAPFIAGQDGSTNTSENGTAPAAKAHVTWWVAGGTAGRSVF